MTATTDRSKRAELVSWPSLTRIVTVVAPDFAVTGVNTTVRLDPDPPKTMLETGSRSWFVLSAVTTRFPAGVTSSVTLKAIAPVE